MTEEPSKRLFAITVSAWRTKEDGQPEVGTQNVVGLLAGDTDILLASLEHARQAYPVAEHWIDHQVVWTEIEQGMMFGPYRLTWNADDTRTGVEQ